MPKKKFELYKTKQMLNPRIEEEHSQPIVETLLSNGLSLLANAVLSKGEEYIKEKTGIDVNKASLSQEELIALKKYEVENEEELLKFRLEENKLDMEEIKAYLADTKGARKREMEITVSEKAPLISKIAAPVIAIATILLTFILFYWVIFVGWDGDPTTPVNQARKEIILYILGVLSAISVQIYGYYFGSSQGSTEKSKILEKYMGGER